MTKEEFFAKLDNNEAIFPETEEQVDWFDEWFENHSAEQERAEKAYQNLVHSEASKYMVMKIFFRLFTEHYGTGPFQAFITEKEIRIFSEYPVKKKDDLIINL